MRLNKNERHEINTPIIPLEQIQYNKAEVFKRIKHVKRQKTRVRRINYFVMIFLLLSAMILFCLFVSEGGRIYLNWIRLHNNIVSLYEKGILCLGIRLCANGLCISGKINEHMYLNLINLFYPGAVSLSECFKTHYAVIGMGMHVFIQKISHQKELTKALEVTGSYVGEYSKKFVDAWNVFVEKIKKNGPIVKNGMDTFVSYSETHINSFVTKLKK